MSVKINYKGIEMVFPQLPSETEIMERYRKEIGRGDGVNRIPLSYAQQAIWSATQLGQQSLSYRIPFALKMKGEFQDSTFRQALKKLLHRQPSLRASVVVDEQGEPGMQLIPDFEPEVQVIDLSSLPDANKESEVEKIINACLREEIPLVGGPLYRINLIKTASDETTMLAILHHLIADGSSVGIFTDELIACFNEVLAGNPDSPTRSGSAIGQQKELANEHFEEDKSYWLQQFSTLPEPVELPLDYKRRKVRDIDGASYTVTLDSMTVQRVKALAKQLGASSYMVYLSVLTTMLYRYSGQEDIVIGTPITIRESDEDKKSIGCYVNMLPIRTDLWGNPTFADLVGRVKMTAVNAYQRQQFPFIKLVELLNPKRSSSITPLFQVVMGLQRDPFITQTAGNLVIESYDIPNSFAEYDLAIDIIEGAEATVLNFQYSVELFKKSTIQRMAGHYLTLLKSAIQSPNERVSEMNMLTESERDWLLGQGEWNEAMYTPTPSLQEMFEQQARQNPERCAVESVAGSLTYGQLNERANQLARYLRSKEIGPDCLVGISVERSLEMLVAMWGIWKAGGAYVPLDQELPLVRLNDIIADSDIRVIIGNSPIPGIHEQATWVNLADESGPWNTESKENLEMLHSPRSLAYVLFTSGSTGKPKGVMIEHRSLLNRLEWMQESFPLNAGDIVLQKTAFTFDVSLWELFWSTIAGARIYMLPHGKGNDFAYILDTIRSKGITVTHFVSSNLAAFLDYVNCEGTAESLRGVRYLFTGAEALYPSTVERFHHLFSGLGIQLCNLYGPTEATIDVTSYPCGAVEERELIPIGKPIKNTNLIILDNHGQLVPIGVQGELCIAGIGVSRGYLNRPDLTAEKFVKNPFNNGTMYRTGDVVRWLESGDIEYIRRADNQIKLRGFRIEPGEIETCLLSNKWVRECAVIKEGMQLLAFIVCDLQQIRHHGDEQSEIPALLKKHVQDRLPKYMVPDQIIAVGQFLYTSSGKIDRRYLQNEAERHSKENVKTIEPPRNETEEKMSSIWRELLNVTTLSIHDNFFDLGGHSLIVPTLMARIKQTFAVDLPMILIFEKSTVAELANEIDTQRTAPTTRSKLVDELEAILRE